MSMTLCCCTVHQLRYELNCENSDMRKNTVERKVSNSKSNPSQSQKRRRVGGTVGRNVLPSKKRATHYHDEQQVEEEEEPHDPRAPRSCGGSGKGSAKDRSIIVSLSDPDVLDCPICFDSFTLPVYQCDNGHVACSDCCIRLEKKCATCSLPIGSNRCRALEKVLESVKVSCPNEEYGCMETLSYKDKKNHKLECTYVPCSCPLPGCDFVASSDELSLHFMNDHDAGEIFMYDYTFSVTLKSVDEAIILQEGTDGKLFIVHNNVVRMGNAVSVNCIGPNCNPGYQYEILVKTEGCSLELKSNTKNIQQSEVGTRSSRFLLIPFDYFGTSEPREVEILIRSNDE